MLPDAEQRKLALDPLKSFIVQAPAGSGKTTLLVERYLTLLSQVNYPEEILAITFTRKAAQEMRTRILTLIATSDRLANENLLQTKLKQWQLLDNPHRLRVQTIDSFCHHLVNRAPLLSKISNNFNIVQNYEAELYYRKAAEEVLYNSEYLGLLKPVVLHLDNDWERLTKLLIAMLQLRDQWLPQVIRVKQSENPQNLMELELDLVIKENLSKIIEYFPKALSQKLIIILQELYSIVGKELPDFFEEFYETITLNTLTPEAMKNICNLLLTKDFSWRKRVTRDQGFITRDIHNKNFEKKLKSLKAQMEALLATLSLHEDLRLSLENFLLSPPKRYQDQQWQVIQSLVQLLPILAAHLKVIFQEKKVVDHLEITMNATDLLGETDNPSNLALNLEHSIQHILIDEFQDTSPSHYRLIEKLIEPWQENDGHTLFLVGDPMQSIYRFRNAEVGLFLSVQNNGIANLKPIPIYLTSNFRSAKVIIQWINETCSKIFPPIANHILGQVSFKPSVALIEYDNPRVNLKILTNGDSQNEATETLRIIKNIRSNYSPEETIAVLVRSRIHLKATFKKLDENNLAYQAIDLELLEKNLFIRDLYSLTKALYDLTDKLAWLAILRAPWCGLQFADLLKISNGSGLTIWDNLNNFSVLELSTDGQEKLKKFSTIFTPFFELRRKLSWLELIKNCWLALGGPATAKDEKELEYAELFFQLLTDNDLSIEYLEKKLSSIFIPQNNSAANIMIMTIHRAKGLEFDHVIIPGINRPTKVDEYKLLLWYEQPKNLNRNALILAPISSTNEKDLIYNYLKIIDQKRSFYETGRLLYVALTRARKSIHLIGSAIEDKPLKPSPGSLWEQLTPVIHPNFPYLEISSAQKNIDSPAKTELPSILRLATKWSNPQSFTFPLNEHSPHLTQVTDNQSQILGEIIHFLLSQLSWQSLSDNFTTNDLEYWSKLLIQEGYNEVKKGIALIQKSLKNITNDPRGRWILANHREAQNELKIATKISAQFSHYIIDRTFIDENNIRWIIDYKISNPNSNNLDQFLSNEAKKHRQQLLNYKKAFNLLDPKHPTKTGLYFPMFSGWIELREF